MIFKPEFSFQQTYGQFKKVKYFHRAETHEFLDVTVRFAIDLASISQKQI